MGEGRRRVSLEAQGRVPQQLSELGCGYRACLGGTLNFAFLWGVEGREGLRPDNGSALGPARTLGEARRGKL